MDSRPLLQPKLRRRRRRALATAIALVLAVLMTTVGTADAQVNDRRTDAATDVRQVDVRPVPTVETLRLACAPDFLNGQRGVLCQWSEATNPHTRAYQLYRIVDGSPRQLLTTVGVDGRLGYFDTDVSAPSSLVYGVISLNRNGRLIGRSAPVHVQYGRDFEQLRMACAPDSIEGHRGVLCRWSETTQPDARGYLLYRVVGTDVREVIAEIPIDGRQAHFDRDVSPGEIHVYVVLAVNGDGDTIGQGGPVRVRWPAAD